MRDSNQVLGNSEGEGNISHTNATPSLIHSLAIPYPFIKPRDISTRL